MLPLEHILIDLCFIGLHLFLFLFNYNVMGKKVFQPCVLFSFVWFIILVLHFLFRFTVLPDLFTISVETYSVFFIGVACFSIGAYLVALLPTDNKNQQIEVKAASMQQDLYLSKSLRLIFLSIIIMGLPLYIQAAIKMFVASQIDDFFVGLRTEISYGDTDFGPTKYLITLSFVVFGINLYSYFKEKNLFNIVLLVLSLLLTLTYAVFATGRTFYLIILALYFGISFFQSKRFAVKKYLGILAIFMAMFIAFGVMYGKGGDKKASNKDNFSESKTVTASYFVASLSAFDLEMNQNTDINYSGAHTLKFFNLIAQKLSLIPEKKLPDLLQSFVFVPYSTNVFTFYSPYIKDYGKLYGWFMIGIFGAVHSFLFRRASQNKNIRYTLYFSFMIYPLLMTFFQDQYLSLLSSWVQIVFYTEAFLFLNQLFKRSYDRYNNS